MVEKGYLENSELRKFNVKASEILENLRTNPFPDQRFGRDWTQKYDITIRTLSYQALKHWEEEFPEVKKDILEGLNATENQLPVNNGDLLLKEVRYYSENNENLLFLSTKDYRRNRNFYILLIDKENAEEAFVIKRLDNSISAQISYYPDGVKLRNPEYRQTFVREGVSPSAANSEFWLELKDSLKKVGQENILPSVTEKWSNYDLDF
jgi:hypothetical protein